MDAGRFDRLTRGLAQVATRRRLLGALVAAPLAGVAGSESARAARVCNELGRSCTRHGQCCSGICRTTRAGGRRRQTCGCVNGKHACGNTCIDLLSDVNNCGACGAVCNTECVDGRCRGETCDGSTAVWCAVTTANVKLEGQDADCSLGATFACSTDSDCLPWIDNSTFGGLTNYTDVACVRESFGTTSFETLRGLYAQPRGTTACLYYATDPAYFNCTV